VVGFVLVLVATIATVATVDTVAASVPSDARDIVMFGHTLSSPGSPGGVWILIGFVATAALAWTVAIAWSRGTRLERRMAAELDERRDLPPRRRASARVSSHRSGPVLRLVELRTSSPIRGSHGHPSRISGRFDAQHNPGSTRNG
jgi:hypothetical protein